VIYQRRWRERTHALIFDESSPSDFSKQISRMMLSLRIKFYNSLPDTIAILNDSTRYQAEPGNADPEALPRL
jgi:hypothetical protein